jgi:tRNA-dihydrouridine synthase
MPRVVALRDVLAPDTLIIGNGDLMNLADAQEKIMASGADGAMLGRSMFGNPWVFCGRSADDSSPQERLKALLTLSAYFDELRPRKSFHILKKHFKAFVHGTRNAAELRATLMEAETHEQLALLLKRAMAEMEA